jgi:hypothetical protein
MFPKTVEKLEKAKSEAMSKDKGEPGAITEIGGVKVDVMPTGCRYGGILYPFLFRTHGIEFKILPNAPQERSAVCIRYLAESVQGHHDRIYNTHKNFVLPFIRKMGFVIHKEILSRFDGQVMFDVPIKEIISLIVNGHAVMRSRNFAVHGKNGLGLNNETFTIGTPTSTESFGL